MSRMKVVPERNVSQLTGPHAKDHSVRGWVTRCGGTIGPRAGRGRRWADRVSGVGAARAPATVDGCGLSTRLSAVQGSSALPGSPRTCRMPYAQPLPLPLPLVPLCAEWDPGELQSVQWAGGRQDPAPLPLWQRRHQPHPHPRLSSSLPLSVPTALAARAPQFAPCCPTLSQPFRPLRAHATAAR